MKTACNELIERLVNISNANYLNGKKSDCDIIDKIKDIVRNEFLEKEKKQIIDARMNGVNAALSFGKAHREPSEEYYNETFKQQ